MSTRPSWSAGPANDAIDIYALRSDTDLLPCKHGVFPAPYLHEEGTVKVTTVDGTDLTLTLPIGLYPTRVKQLWSTGTSFTGSTTTKVSGIY